MGILNTKSFGEVNNWFSEIIKFKNKNNFSNKLLSNEYNFTENIMCLTVADVDYALSMGPFLLAINALVIYVGILFGLFSTDIHPGPTFYDLFAAAIAVASLLAGMYNPLRLIHIVDFKTFLGSSHGWIKTFGLLKE